MVKHVRPPLIKYKPALCVTRDNHHISGNALFIVLLGVFLFGALTFSVTRSSNSGGANALNEDKAAIYAAEVLQYADAIKGGIDRMQLLHGVKEHEFDFGTDVNDYVEANPNATCTSNKCRLFHPEGGAVKPRFIPDEFYDPESSVVTNNSTSVLNEIRFFTVDVIGIGTSGKNDLIVAVTGMHRDICDQINLKTLGLSAAPSMEVYGDWDSYSGTLTSFPDGSGEISPVMFNGKKTFCFGHGNNIRIFVHVLIER